KVTPVWTPGRKKSRTAFSGDTLWYRDRRQAEDRVLDWLMSSLAKPRVVIVPTIEDGFRLQAAFSQRGGMVPFFSSQLSPAQYRRLYSQVLTGALKHVIGLGSAAA